MADYLDVITPFLENKFDEVLPPDFYRELFPAGVLQERGEEHYGDGKYNAIALELTNRHTTYTDKDGRERRKPLTKRHTVTDDLDLLDELEASKHFVLMAPLAYAGKTRKGSNARICFAIVVDLDNIWIRNGYPDGLANFLYQTEEVDTKGTLKNPLKIGSQPLPTFIVSSGTGVHLYYVFDQPICLFEETVKQLQKLKRSLTTKIWHDSIVDIRDERDIQQEGIFQGFRLVGGITKKGTCVRAFKTGKKVDIDYLNQFVPSDSRIKNYRLYDEKYVNGNEPYPTQLSLMDKGVAIDTKLTTWKDRNPDWYERRVVRGEPRKTWCVNRNLYDWWLREISQKARVSHRYWCISMLAVYAVKCSHYDAEKNPDPVTYDELEKDAFSLVELFDSLTTDPDNHFTNDDVMAALEFWQDNWSFYKRDYVSYRAGFEIKENKRNGRTREDHLEVCRLIKKQKARKGELQNPDGRPSKQGEVRLWRLKHPNGKIIDCIKDTGMARATIKKWWGEKNHSD